MANLGRWQGTIVDEVGEIQAGASIEVRRDVAGTPLADLYSDRTGATPLANPFTADADGFGAFHAVGGPYQIVATLGSFSITWRYVPVGTAGEADAEDFVGEAAGQKYTYSTTTADADPGSGIMRLNHATPSSATAAYLDNNNKDGSAVNTWLDTFDDYGVATDRGLLHLFNPATPGTNFRIYRITGSVTDGTGYRKLTLVHVVGAGTFANLDTLQVNFYARGVDGAGSSERFTYSTTTADADPGSGIFRLNNATLASVTAAYIDNNNADGSAVSGWLDTFDDSGTSANRGMLHIRNPATPGTNFRIYQVSGSVTDGTGYRKLTLAHVAGAGSFSASDVLSIAFVPRGADGAGSVTGPGSSTDNAAVRFDGTGGGTLQNSAFIIDDTGHVSAFGGNIVFPATQAASANANTLDDYEEGTWTPTLTFATPGNLSVTYSVRSGTYTKIGRLVNMSGQVTTSAFTHTTASGAMSITGLPFTSLAGATNVAMSTAFGGITKASYTQFGPFVLPNTTQLDWYGFGSGQAAATITTADMPTGGTVLLSQTGSYPST